MLELSNKLSKKGRKIKNKKMKKTLITLLIAFALIFTGTGIVQAQSPMEGCELVRPITINCSGDSTLEGQGVCTDGEARLTPDNTNEIDEDFSDQWAVICMINMVNQVAQIAFFLMMGLVAALVIVGGFFVLTGGGKEENIAKGKKFITYAIVGVLVAAFAYAVPAILQFVI